MTSIVDRAWGFTEAEYVKAFARILSREDAETKVALLFDDLRANPDHSVGGEDSLFALLSLVSEDASDRVRSITGWSPEEMTVEQLKLTNRQ